MSILKFFVPKAFCSCLFSAILHVESFSFELFDLYNNGKTPIVTLYCCMPIIILYNDGSATIQDNNGQTIQDNDGHATIKGNNGQTIQDNDGHATILGSNGLTILYCLSVVTLYCCMPIIILYCLSNVTLYCYPLTIAESADLGPSICVHTGVPFSLKNLEVDKDEMTPVIMEHLKKSAPELPKPDSIKSLKWRYSQVSEHGETSQI